MPIKVLAKNNDDENLIKQATAYQNTLAFFHIATLCPQIKSETNELLENYTTVLRIRQEQDADKPRVDTTYELSQLAVQSREYIASHPDLTTFYALQPTRGEVLFKPVESYYDLWRKSRQRS